MSIKIEGLKEVQKKLKSLPGNVQRRVVRGATRAGANIVKKEAQRNVPVRQDGKLKRAGKSKAKGYRYPGYLKKNIGLIRNKRVPKNVFSFLVKTLKFAYYGAFLEFGTSKMSAKPWLRPAYESKRYFAVKRIRERILKGIDREVKKLK